MQPQPNEHGHDVRRQHDGRDDERKQQANPSDSRRELPCSSEYDDLIEVFTTIAPPGPTGF